MALVVNLAFTAFLPLLWIIGDSHLLRFRIMMMTRRRRMMAMILILAMKMCLVDPAWLRFPPWAAWGGDQPLTWLSYFLHKDDHEDDFDSKLANTHICPIHLREVTWSSWSPSPSSKCLKPFLRQPTVTRKSSRSFLPRWFCSGEPSSGKPSPASTTSPSLSTKWLPRSLCFSSLQRAEESGGTADRPRDKY